MKTQIPGFRVLLALILALVTTSCRTNKALESQTASDARALQDFNQRVQDYIKIHHRAETDSHLAHIKATHSGQDIVKRQHAMGDRIHALRGDTKPGNIFTPEIAAYFNQALDTAYQANAEGISASLACVSQETEARLKPNDIYPEGSDYNMMPPTMLLHIPRLTAELEYRIVNKDLVIRDVEANLIVDVLRDAIRTVPGGARCDD